MSIALAALTKRTATILAHACSGSDRLLIVAVAWIPSTWQELSSITYNGIALTIAGGVLVKNDLALAVGYLVNPPEGEHDVVVSLTDSALVLCEAASYTGVSQSDAVWRVRDGVGDMVTSIPVNTWTKTGAITLGIGAVDDVEAENDKLYGNQVLVWNETGSTLRMDGISALGTADNDSIPLPNKLTKASDWALIIIWVNPS